MSNYPMTRRHIQEKRMPHRHRSKKKEEKTLRTKQTLLRGTCFCCWTAICRSC